MAVEAWRTQASFPFLANLCDIDPDVAVGEPFTDELLVELRRVTAATVVCPRVTLGSGDGHTGD